MAERLQKVMAECGVASRRASEKIITAGRVKVNGQTVTELGTKVGPNDAIEVDGHPLKREAKRYFLLNKPRGVISSAHDDKGRKTVVDIVHDAGVPGRIYPVGRLDYDTTGVLILTNDGQLANTLMHPRYSVDKTYVAKVSGDLTVAEVEQLRHGVQLDKTHRSRPARVKRLKNRDQHHQSSWVRLTIHEGHYHQVKRMLKAVGHPVEKLNRESYDGLDAKGLNPGQFRELSGNEVRRLKENANR